MTYKELVENHKWFMKIFKNIITEEGWFMYESIMNNIVVLPSGNKKIQMSDIIKTAADYGWTVIPNRFEEVYETYIAVDFDINKLTRNKHLIAAAELNLM